MKSPLFLFLLFPISAYSASGPSFDGCKGLTVTRSRDFSQVDVSADLKKAEKRISDLCGKVIPKKLKAIDANAQSCVAGSTTEIGPGLAGEMKAKVQAQMSGFDQRVKEACDSMKKTMEESKRACGVRQSTLSQLNKGIATIQQTEGGQADSLKNVVALYGGAVSAYGQTAKAAGEAKEKIYAQLPDKDEGRARQMRTGQESASTPDFKTDKLVSEWKSTLTLLAKDNKKKQACVKLAANGGQLDEMAGILKNNLWPNGKIAARAMSRIESADKEKSAEFAAQKAESEKRAAAAEVLGNPDQANPKKSDISGTPEEGLVKQTPEQLAANKRKAEEGISLQQKTKQICDGKGGCNSEEAVWSAIKQAQASEQKPAEVVNNQYTPAGDYTGVAVDQPGVLDDLARTSPVDLGKETANAPDVVCVTSVWGWWPPGYTQAVGVKKGNECIVD
jgi:hypothetical protein